MGPDPTGGVSKTGKLVWAGRANRDDTVPLPERRGITEMNDRAMR